MPCLIVHRDDAEHDELQLEVGSYVIGRSRECEIFLPYPSLSRRHARLDITTNGAEVRDLDSKNGTFVDGVKVRRQELQGGETLRCGSFSLTFVSDPVPSPEPECRFERSIEADPLRLDVGELLGPRGEAKTAIRLPAREDEPQAQAKLRILLKVSQLLSSPEGIDELLQKILDLTLEILEIDRAAILSIDESTGAFEEWVVKTRPGLPRAERAYSEHIVRYVCDHSVAAIFTDTHLDPRLKTAVSVVQQSICSSVCAPLKAREKLLGVLYIDKLTGPDRFTDDDLEFLTGFANQAALAIDNSLLSTKLRREAVQRNNLRRFFPPAVIGKIMEESKVSLDTREMEVTVLFCDISGFSALSAEMPPRRLVSLLNRYFPVMAKVVFDHEGTLEKYIGDALLAIWGAPYPRPDDADRALRAAIDMQRAILEFNRSETDGPGLEIHIGLNSGQVAAGNIGSEHYLQYATVGDTTNMASRVCDIAAGGEILIAESTYRRLGEAPCPIEELEAVQVKGRGRPLGLYRLDWRARGVSESSETVSRSASR